MISRQQQVLNGRRSSAHFGREVRLGEWPHNVLIFEFKDDTKCAAFCAGSIISEEKVLTSAHCFLTNRKKRRREFEDIRFVASILTSVANVSEALVTDEGNRSEQWRSMERLHTQKFFRFPAFNLAVAVMSEPWVFNEYVNKIPYATLDMDFDGVCTATAVKATRSWSKVKYLYTQEVEIVQRKQCESKLYRNSRLYFCSISDKEDKNVFSETEGGGLVCYETGDPAEKDNQGVLVGVTSVMNIGIPNLHMRYIVHLGFW
ncbi:hypothetical protein PYW07_003193 [Mythimna separata]|uniref:Peptidase S1 domain-containing protein n=1 Tax=Mythimna separata TaxID=271217 RepID=A0AAD7YI77_MYTSE|nr:hypothetical protein PYW07_003193 [Mythimna separata]